MIYEGKNKNYLVNNLDDNTKSEIRLCSFYNNIVSELTQIYKIKTSYSVILIINKEKENI